MNPKWSDLKERAMAQRRKGVSMTLIERELGIPRSTLSGWFKTIKLTESQRTKLMKNKRDAWKIAREKAVIAHQYKKSLRLLEAKQEAEKVINKIELTDELLDIAFAMLYLREGSKNDTTSLSSSEPKVLRFFLYVLQRNYGIDPNLVRCDLHLRMDQDPVVLKRYWSEQLKIPIERFKYVSFDKRSEGKPTYDCYKGVCVINCGHIAIQRKLVYLYDLFIDKITDIDSGV